jgi:1-acyl-sn-glycerol-3-phosphate acyltransferase
MPFLILAPLAYLPLPTRIVWPFVVAWLRGVMWLLKWVIGQGFEIRNASRRPPGAVLLASAHQSTWENMFFQVLIGNPAMIAKEELFRYPLVGEITRRNRHIRAFRGGHPEMVRRSLAEARQQADAGRSILIYPSGTRTGVQRNPPMRRGVAALYAVLERPCVPIAHNSGLYWMHPSFLRRRGTIIVEFGEPIPAGLPKREFMELLEARLNGATERLLSVETAGADEGEPTRRSAAAMS